MPVFHNIQSCAKASWSLNIFLLFYHFVDGRYNLKLWHQNDNFKLQHSQCPIFKTVQVSVCVSKKHISRVLPDQQIAGPLKSNPSKVGMLNYWQAFYGNAKTCGQSYKAPTIVIYDSRGVPDLKLPHITTLES